MITLNRTPKNFIVDLHSLPYELDLSPISVGTRRYQALSCLVLAPLFFIAGFWDMPYLILLSFPITAYAAFLFFTCHKITFHDNNAEIFTQDLMTGAHTSYLIYQNYEGVQAGSRSNRSLAQHTDFTVTLIHQDPSLNLPLLDLPDSQRAHNLAQLFATMLDVPLLQAKLYQNPKQAQAALA